MKEDRKERNNCRNDRNVFTCLSLVVPSQLDFDNYTEAVHCQSNIFCLCGSHDDKEGLHDLIIDLSNGRTRRLTGTLDAHQVVRLGKDIKS